MLSVSVRDSCVVSIAQRHEEDRMMRRDGRPNPTCTVNQSSIGDLVKLIHRRDRLQSHVDATRSIVQQRL